MAVNKSSSDTRIAALIPVESDPLAAPRVVSGTADNGAATEDGAAVVLSVLGNDTGVVGIVQVNGNSVTPGSVITLPSGVQIVVGANGTLSFLVGGAYQQLAAGQTATETFTYVATDGGGSSVAPDGFISAGALTSAKGFTITGAAAGDLAGYAVAGIGDVNSDGIDDVLIGALQADPGGRTSAGTAYVLYGKAGGYTGIDLAALTTAQGFSIRGFAALDFLGTSVSAAGDINGDGRADFIVGAPKANGPAGVDVGAAYVIFGQATGGFVGGIDVSSLNGTNGFVIRGGAATDSLGFSVSAAGDVNGDGRADLIVGARDADPAGHSGAGKSYVLFGHTGAFSAAIDVTTLNGTNGFSISGIDADDQSGLSVAAAGDLNNDGFADLIVGAAGGDPGARTNAGEAYVVFGKAGGFAANLDLSTLNGTNGFVLNGIDAGDFAGWSVNKAGDLNNDGIDDIAIGALYGDPSGRTNAGEIYILYGRGGGGFGASLNLSSIAGTTGFVISGGAAGDLTGHTVSSAGDVNADGIDDLLIGALYADPEGSTDAGQSYILFGRNGGYASVDLSLLNGLTGFAIGGGTTGGYSGQAVSAAGDLNNDGIDDLIIGSPNADPSGRTDAGASYVLYGAPNIARLTSPVTVTVTITGTNDAPVITSNGGGATASTTRAENGTSVATITAVDIDNGSGLTYSIAGGADASRFTINATTGVLTFVAAPDFEAPTDAGGNNVYDVIVRASDGTASDTQAFAVTVTNQNEAPVISSNGGGATANLSQAENLTAVTTVVASDVDAGTMLTYSIIGGADAARFTINSLSGVLSFVSAPNFEAPTDSNGDNVYNVIVQVSDGSLTDTQTLAVTITNAAETPVITSGGGGTTATASTAEGSTVVATITATDPDGTTPTWAIVGGADAARFKINAATGLLEFKVAPNFEAPTDVGADNVYDVIVRASDGTLFDTQAIAVTVTNVAEAPVITSNGGGATATRSLAENLTTVTTNLANDPDGTTPTWSIAGGADAAFFLIDATTGVLRFANAPDFETPGDANGDNNYEVTVQASDGALVDTQALTVTITNANESPVITSGGGGTAASYDVVSGTTGAIANTAVDPDAGSTLTWAIIGGVDQGFFTINATTGVLDFVSPPSSAAPADNGANNIYQVQIRVSDGARTDVQTLNIRVTPAANAAPVITSLGGGPTGAYSIFEGTLGPTTVSATDPDGTTPTYSIIGGADAAFFTIDSSTGVLQLVSARDFETPADANGNNVYEVIVRAFDGALSDTQTISLTILNTNEAPVITSGGGGTNATASVAENTTAVTTVTASDPDAGSTLTFSIVGGADQGLFTINATTGALAFISGRDFENPTDAGGNNVYDVTVQVSDGTITDTQSIAVTVTNGNEAPVITSGGGGANATATTPENMLGITTVTATDPDAGATLTYSIIGGADQAQFSINATTGVLSFVSTRNFEAPTDAGGNNVYDVIVQVSDGTLSDSQAIAVTVTNTNEPPAITSGGGGTNAAASVAENTTAVTTVTATDPDAGATLTFSIVGGADQGLFTINASTGALAFISGRNFESPSDSGADNVYDVVVQVSDGANTDTQAIAVTVTNVNEAPTININGSAPTAVVNVPENPGGPTTLPASDPDGNTLTYSITGGADAALFTLNPSTGAIAFITDPNFEAPHDANGDNDYQVTIQVSDGSLTDTQAITFRVFNLNEAPVITSNGGGTSATASVAENTTAVTTVTASDQDAGASLTYSLAGGADQALFTINSTTGVLSFASIPNFEAPADAGGNNVYDVVVRVSDGTNTDTQAIAVTVTNQNEAPVITSNGGGAVGSYTISENTLGPNPITATDPDAGSTITYSIIGGADAARFTINGAGILQLAANPNFEAPTDANGDNVYTVIVQASDGSLTDTQTINLTVSNQNEAPVITSNGGGATASKSVVENSTVVTTVTATDPDGVATPLTFSIVGGSDSSLFTIDANTGALSFISGRDFENPTDANADNVYNVTVQASDGVNVDTQDIKVTVTNRNDAPVITSNGGGVSATITRAENGPLLVTTVTATDQDAGATISYMISGGADAARFTINTATGQLSFVANPDFEAPTDSNGDNKYIVIVRASDGTLTDVQTITVVITDVGELGAPPTITSNGGGPTAAVNVAENTTAVTTVTATDPDTPGLTYSIAGGIDSALFTINATTGALSFVSGRNFEAPTDSGGNNVYDVIVQVSDGVSTDTQAIAVTVTGVNEAPVITSGGGGTTATYNVNENLNPGFVATLASSDPDAGATATWTIIGGADAALFTLNATTGVLEFIGPHDFENPDDADLSGVYQVIVQVSDNALNDTQAINVTITDVNEGPVIITDGGGAVAAINVQENTDLVTTVTANDPDTGATLTYSIVGGIDQTLFTIDSSTGELHFVTAPDFENPTDSGNDNLYTVVVRASDGTLFDDQTINVTVVDNNEPPVITSDGGGATANVSVIENEPDATIVQATDPEGQPVTYSIVGGPDGALFTINPNDGLLSFAVLPDFESPQDFNGDNVYEVIVRAEDGSGRGDSQTVFITVTNDATETGPTLTGLIGLFKVDEAGPVMRIDSDVTFTNAQSIYSGATLRVSGLTSNDVASVISFGTGPGQVSTSVAAGSVVLYQGVVIGSLTGGAGGADLVITFNGSATRQAIEAVVEALGYRSTATDTVPDHTLTIAITDPVAQVASAQVRVQFNANVLNGTPGPDTLNGFAGADTITGFQGNDTLDGGNGDDVISGNEDDDTLNGGIGHDSLFGGDGSDTLNGQEGSDFLYGGDGFFDILNGGDDADHIYGGLGIDSIDGGAGDDVLFGDEGNDNIITGDGFNLVFGGADNDLVYGGLDVDILHGDDGDDELHGSDGDDQMSGGAGNDTLNGDAGDDSLEGGDDDDSLRGGSDDDFLDGGAGADDLDGGGGNDIIRGGDDNDVIFGGEDDDNINGEGGDDYIYAGDGDSDTIDGGGDRLEDTDEVEYGNSIALYSFVLGTNNDIFVTGPGGFVDHLYNIEFLKFTDARIDIGNDVPKFTYDDSAAESSIDVDENQTFILSVPAVDDDINDTLTFSIVDGADAGLFVIDGSTGDLSFILPMDFEAPTDADGDGIYDVELAVSDGRSEDRLILHVRVVDVAGGIIVDPKAEPLILPAAAPKAEPPAIEPPMIEIPTGVEGGWLF